MQSGVINTKKQAKNEVYNSFNINSIKNNKNNNNYYYYNYYNSNNNCPTIKGRSVSTMIMMIDVSTKPIAISKRIVE